MLLLYPLMTYATAVESPEVFLVTNPILPSMTILADGVVSLTELEDFMKFRVWDANLRGYQIYNKRWGLMAQLDYTQSNLIWKTTHIGCKVGPRLSLQNTGFEGWGFTAYGLMGYTNLTASRYPLSRWTVVGAGTELGKSFVWNHFVLDLGVGLYSTRNLRYRTDADALEGSEVPEGLSTVPSIHTGIGYAF